MTLTFRVILLFAAASVAAAPTLSQEVQAHKPLNLVELLKRQRPVLPHLTTPSPDAVSLGLATAKVYRFSTADYPGADTSTAFDLDTTTGVVVGEFFFSVSSGGGLAFILAGNTYRILDIPGSLASAATGINSSGQIAGAYEDATKAVHGFVDNAGTFTTIDFPGPTGPSGTEIFDINDGGVLVGTYEDTSNITHGFVDNAGTFTTIDPPGSTFTIATGIDTAGDVVGIWTDAASKSHGFLLSGGVYTQLDFPLATSTSAIGINDSSEISGTYSDAANISHGFIYSRGAWSKVDVAGAASTELLHIKNTGAVLGEYTDDKNEGHGIRGH